MAAVNDLEQIGDVIEVSLVDPGEKRVRKLILTIRSAFVIRMNIVSVAIDFQGQSVPFGWIALFSR